MMKLNQYPALYIFSFAAKKILTRINRKTLRLFPYSRSIN